MAAASSTRSAPRARTSASSEAPPIHSIQTPIRSSWRSSAWNSASCGFVTRASRFPSSMSRCQAASGSSTALNRPACHIPGMRRLARVPDLARGVRLDLLEQGQRAPGRRGRVKGRDGRVIGISMCGAALPGSRRWMIREDRLRTAGDRARDVGDHPGRRPGTGNLIHMEHQGEMSARTGRRRHRRRGHRRLFLHGRLRSRDDLERDQGAVRRAGQAGKP